MTTIDREIQELNSEIERILVRAESNELFNFDARMRRDYYKCMEKVENLRKHIEWLERYKTLEELYKELKSNENIDYKEFYEKYCEVFTE